MNFRRLTNSQFGVETALGLGRALPPGVGYAFAGWVAGQIASRKRLTMVQAVRANQWVVSGCELTPFQLDEMVRRVFRHIARCQYDFFHLIGDDQGVLDRTEFDPEFEKVFPRIKSGEAGTLFVCPHLSNFDLMGRALALRGLRYQVLTVPEAATGYQLQNKMRQQAGIEATPISFTSLRQAGERLRNGGVVLTGIDRPLPGSKYRPKFFGRPAALPVSHVRLALKTGVPITLVGCQMKPGGMYHLLTSDPIPMRPRADLMEETEMNAEVLLEAAAQWIRETPEQWSLTYPVWPEVNQEMKGNL